MDFSVSHPDERYNTPHDLHARIDDPSEAYGPNRQREVYASGMLADQ